MVKNTISRVQNCKRMKNPQKPTPEKSAENERHLRNDGRLGHAGFDIIQTIGHRDAAPARGGHWLGDPHIARTGSTAAAVKRREKGRVFARKQIGLWTNVECLVRAIMDTIDHDESCDDTSPVTHMKSIDRPLTKSTSTAEVLIQENGKSKYSDW